MQHPIVLARRTRRPRPAAWLRAHPHAADLILAILLTAITVVAHIVGPDSSEFDYRPATWWTVPLAAAAVLPIARRRVNPIATALVVVVAQIIVELFDIGGPGFIGVTIGVYSLGAHSWGRRRTQTVTAIASLLGVLLLVGLFDDELDFGSFVWTIVILTTAFVLGDNLRRRRDAAHAIRERLERVERERELIAHQHVTAERTRIARELHDVVAHSVSVMVIQAAAARRNLRTSPSIAEEALENIEATGRQTMNELRGILGVLRRSETDDRPADDARPGASLTPQPTLRSVRDLVDAARDLPIELSVVGVITDLPPSVDLAGFRVVQEAITNVRRHAGPVALVEVSIRRDGEVVEIDIVDDGRGSAADDQGPGYGLVGMHERLDAIGGSLVAAPRRGGGWHVRATLPVHTHRLAAASSDPAG
jgi:signal transduction histidine kinase